MTARKRDASFFIMKHGRRDANHADVRDGLRKHAIVIDTAGVGDGVFDLIMHLGSDRWCWLEVKVPGGELTTAERKWQAKLEAAGARTAVIHSVAEGLAVRARAGGVGGPTEAQLARIVTPVHQALQLASSAVRDFRNESTEARVRRLATPNRRGYR